MTHIKPQLFVSFWLFSGKLFGASSICHSTGSIPLVQSQNIMMLLSHKSNEIQREQDQKKQQMVTRGKSQKYFLLKSKESCCRRAMGESNKGCRCYHSTSCLHSELQHMNRAGQKTEGSGRTVNTSRYNLYNMQPDVLEYSPLPVRGNARHALRRNSHKLS